MCLQSLFYFSYFSQPCYVSLIHFLFAHFRNLTITYVSFGRLTSDWDGSKSIMQHIYSPIFVQIELSTRELCAILKNAKMICWHAHRVICFTE